MGSQGTPCRILVVDDDRMENEIMSAFLSQLGTELEAECALSIEEAIESISVHRPDIVFLDNRIPPDIDFRNGYERIRKAGYDGAIIVHSVVTDDPVFEEAAALGVSRVVDKFHLRKDSLRELVAAHCSGKPT
jgi:CheY-like chemotaxis protein